MHWRLTLILAYLLTGGSTIALMAQETSEEASEQTPEQTPAQTTPQTDEQAEPRNLRQLTRILRSPERSDELEGAIAELDAMIAEGDAEAALLLGDEYTRGRGSLPLDYELAVDYLEKAAALDQPETYLRLSELHRRETGGLPRSKTTQYLQAAADAGIEEALMPLAEALRRGTYGPPDIGEAIRYYDAAVAAGDTTAATRLAAIYKAGTGSPDDGANLAKYLGISAEAGDMSARMALADLYLRGNVVPGDPALAEQNLRAAIAQGNASAQTILATALLRGTLGENREDEAVALLQSAFDGGDISTASPLANAYLRGSGVSPDVPKALEILRRGAEGEDTKAKADLFNLYVRGSGRNLAPDLAAASALYGSIPEAERTENVQANAALLAAYGRSLADFARTWELFEDLSPGLQARTGQQLLRINANAYVYVLQGLLSERGHYASTMSGQLDSPTIAAINSFCAARDITKECRFGPLARTTWLAISAELAD